MKKSYLMIAAAAALFAACSNTDTFKDVDVQEAVIGLNGQYVEKPTKAEITSAWLTTANSKFGVFGYRYAADNANAFTLFSNEEVTYVTSPSADWTHTTVRYWDKGANDEYYFYAYAPYSASATFSRTNGLTYTLPSNVFLDTDDATDLCIAGAVEETDYAECSDAHVHFTFSHVLSKLSFKVIKTGFGANESVRLTSITFAAPSVTSATWNQNDENATTDADITYVDLANPTSSSDLTAKVAFNDTGADDGNNVVGVADVVVGATAANIIAGSNSFIVLPNNAPQDPTDIQANEKHLIKLAVGYELTYSDGETEPQTAYGDVALLYQKGNHYIVTINIKPVEIQFHADVINGFNDVTVSESFDVQ